MTPDSISGFSGFLYILLLGVVHLVFAIGVYRDAVHLTSKQDFTFAAAPLTWAAATLLGGVFALLVYWLIHHSSLRTKASVIGHFEEPPTSEI